MSSFSITRKKTPFQKHREEEEAKKKVCICLNFCWIIESVQDVSSHALVLFLPILQRAEDETARLYAEFVESFQTDSTPGSKAFVRGGMINPNERPKTDSEGQYILGMHFHFVFVIYLPHYVQFYSCFYAIHQ